jgi:vacuolar protein sorting-associated protein 13A/C
MLEGLVASLLNRFLGMYIRNFDPKQLNVGILSGDVKLRDLELRKEALDQLKLPINVVEGHLGALTLSIPWSNLRGQPVKVFIEDVFLLAAPKEDAEYDEDEEERRKQAVKIEKLDSAEMLKERSQADLSQEEQQKNQSFVDSLVTKIVDNVQVSIKNIHVRYEDSISAPGHPFALGVTLEEFSAVSTDGEWKPTYIQNSKGSTHKLATLGALAVYWNTDTSLLGTGREADVPENPKQVSHEEMMRMFKDMIVRGESPDVANHQFILKPVSGQAKIELDKSGSIDHPKIKAGLSFDEIGVVLDDDQYRDSLMLVDLMHSFVRHQEYKKFQPKGTSPKEDPKAWFRFAGNAVLNKIHDKNRRWSWGFFKERRDDRVRYIELFKKKKQDETLSPDETEELNKLEWKTSYEDLRFWRSLARTQLKKENVGKPKPKAQQKQGWIAWAWGSKPAESQEEEEQETITDEDRKRINDAIEYDEKMAIAESVDLPRETVKMQIDATLNTGSLTLKQSPHKDVVEVASLYFDGFKASFLQRPDSFLANVALGGLRVNDNTTKNSLYPQIVRVKNAPSTGTVTELDDDYREGDEESREAAMADPFFQVEFEKNPLDQSADLKLSGKLKSMEIIYNPSFVVGIVQFFKPPERHMESISALMESASATVEGLRQQTRAGLEFALDEHKTINAKLDLQAPLIIIPESIEFESATCLIIDAGHVGVTSELVDKDTLQEIQSKQRQTYSEEDYKRLESLMYDKFLLKLSSTQVLIGPSVQETKLQLQKRDESKSMHIVDKINIEVTVETSIIPKAPNVAKLRVSGHLPVLQASVSDSKYKNLMRIIDVAIPRFNEDAPSQQVVKPSKSTNVTKRPRAKSTLSQKSKKRTESTSFQFSAQQRAIILDADSDSDDDDVDFQDADDGGNGDLKVQQRNFELRFTVDKLQGSLFKSDPEQRKPDQLLAELVAERFHLDLNIRPFDMTAEVTLGSLNVDDHVEENPTAEFKSIISSGDTDSQDKNLVHVKFIKVNRKSPEFMSVYEGIETNLDCAISTINLVVTRKTLLTLLDFILITFTNPATGDAPSPIEEGADEGEEDSSNESTAPTKSDDPDKIRIKVDLKGIVLILNNDGMRLATLTLNTADVGIFLMGKTMRIGARLGALSLIDDVNVGASKKSPLRQLITIEGDDLADFRYETFDSESSTYPGHDSSVYLRAGSIKFHFMEEPFRKIIDFLVKFGRMQAIMNAARQAAANQASQIQQNPPKMQFDILVQTPIVVFPRSMTVGQPKRDLITAYLGEIYAQNKFVPLDDSQDSIIAMKLDAGIRNIRLTSEFFFEGGTSEELELVSQVDLGFQITYAEHTPGAKRPDLEISGQMTDFNFRVSQAQLKFLLELSRSVPAAFSGDSEVEEAAAGELPQSTVERAKAASPNVSNETDEKTASLGPELSLNSEGFTKLDLHFAVRTIGLELILAKEDGSVGNLDASSLSKFSLDDTNVKLRMISDGSLESELLIHSFTIMDSRTQETNKFRKIMTSANTDVQQFMASVTISGGRQRNLIAMVAIDSPRVIFALDYLFALQSFIQGGLAVDEPPMSEELDAIVEDSAEASDTEPVRIGGDDKSMRMDSQALTAASQPAAEAEKDDSKMNIAFRVNVVDAQIILIANPLSSSSEAIVLGTKQILMSQQHALTLQVSKMGMFLCRMDRFEDTRLRILDDFSLQLSMDTSEPDRSSIHIDIEPLVLRLSLRDILLATQIVKKASELSANDDNKPQESASDLKAKQYKGSSIGLKQRTPSGKAPSTLGRKTKKTGTTSRLQREPSSAEARVVQKHEELTATLDGMRMILIGDLHELPILDLSVKSFTATAQDWSGQMQAGTEIDMFVNIYNFSKSAWEPLIEPWQLGFKVSKQQNPDLLSIDLISKKTLEVTITSASIALASKSVTFLTQDEDILSKPRGADAPYRIRNYTGFDLNVWADIQGDDEPIAAKLSDGEEAPWRFEDWEKMRENLSPDTNTGIVGVKMEGSGFDSINKIPINREGETIYSLRPRQGQILHRLLVEVKLGADNVKCITFRSPLLVENNTQIPVELGIYDSENDHLLKIEKIAPGESRPAPVGASFEKALVVRPDQGFGYTWSNESLWWRDLLRRPTRTLTCKGEDGGKTPPFYFQMHANFDKSNPLTRYDISQICHNLTLLTTEQCLPVYAHSLIRSRRA